MIPRDKHKRARRRRDLRRMKRKAIRIFGWSSPERAIQWANHLKMCSCWMCCNPRRNGELTFQELKFAQGVDREHDV
jgi:hypothetical protein